MTRLVGLASFVWLFPACALSFEPLGLEQGDASASADSGGVIDVSTPDVEPLDGGEPGQDGGDDDRGVPLDRGVVRPDVGPRVSVTLISAGSNDAWFHSEPAGLDCQGTGSFDVPVHSSWSVTAEPGIDRVFSRWTQGPCHTSTTAVCRFTADESLTLKADYDRP